MFRRDHLRNGKCSSGGHSLRKNVKFVTEAALFSPDPAENQAS